MLPESVLGLPLHPLVVHGTVVLVPLAAALVAGAALVPRLRRWAGPLPVALSLVALVLVPISTSSGETLEDAVEETELVERHADLGEQLLPLVAVLFVAALALWLLGLHAPGRLRALTLVVTVVAVLAAVATTVQTVRIGHAGAEAAWSDVQVGDDGELDDRDRDDDRGRDRDD